MLQRLLSLTALMAKEFDGPLSGFKPPFNPLEFDSVGGLASRKAEPTALSEGAAFTLMRLDLATAGPESDRCP